MRLGATLTYLSPAPPVDPAAWARRLVDAGFESLWVPQVLGRGSWVPDPVVALAAAAVATQGVELGTATLQLPLHHPAALAHRILTLATVCGDRLTIGVSPGSTPVDHTTLGRDFSARWRTFDEHLARLRVLLAEGRDDEADLAPPGSIRVPPLLLGSWGARVERAAREFDGWIASAFRSSGDDMVAAHARYRAAGGRRAVVCAVPVRTHADLAPTRDLLDRLAHSGFDDAVVLFEPGGPSPDEVRALHP